jgi:hypothetical protein
MTPDLTPEAWAQIRHDYEHTERPVDDICAEHGISAGTLRNRMRRWRWTRRRAPIPLDGPPPAPALPLGFAAPALTALPEAETTTAVPPDDRPIAERLQSAVARVLPAIEGTLATLATGAAHPRELERAARVLAALTRTLRELSGLLAQHQTKQPACERDQYTPEQVDAWRFELARKINALVDERTGVTASGEPFRPVQGG